MASNNTDWAYGESRHPNNDLLIPAKVKAGETGVKPGHLVKISAGWADDLLEVELLDSTDTSRPIGVVNATPVNGVNAKGGDVIVLLVRGLTTIRNVCGADISLGGIVAQKDGKTVIKGTSSAGPGFGRNIGGALTASSDDTGLIYIDCWGLA